MISLSTTSPSEVSALLCMCFDALLGLSEFFFVVSFDFYRVSYTVYSAFYLIATSFFDYYVGGIDFSFALDLLSSATFGVFSIFGGL